MNNTSPYKPVEGGQARTSPNLGCSGAMMVGVVGVDSDVSAVLVDSNSRRPEYAEFVSVA